MYPGKIGRDLNTKKGNGIKSVNCWSVTSVMKRKLFANRIDINIQGV